MTTFAACLTPPGAAAIAVLAVRGPAAWDIVGPLFSQRTPASGGREPPVELFNRGLTPPARPWGPFFLGRFGEDAADEVVLSIIRNDPVPWLELQCHGGVEVVRMCLDVLRRRGAEVCSWQDLELRTTDNRLRSTALAALTEAPTARTAAILLDQFHGAFEKAVRDILERDDIDRLAELARYTAVGRHLTQPWRVVIAGAPNVGKSSLANALAGYQRSVVSPQPGTTRDVVSAVIAVDGWPVELTDTAGLRFGADALEEAGIRQAQDAVASADLCLWLLDGAASPVWPENASEKLHFVVNKIDLPAAWDHGEASGAMAVSARTGAGVAELVQALAGWLVPGAPPAGAAIPFTAEFCERIEAAYRCHLVGARDEVRRLLVETVVA